MKYIIGTILVLILLAATGCNNAGEVVSEEEAEKISETEESTEQIEQTKKEFIKALNRITNN